MTNPTIREKTQAAFKALRKTAGYRTRSNFKCCQGCAWAEFPETATKVVFWHRQDNACFAPDGDFWGRRSAPRGAWDAPKGALYLAWRGNGQEIVDALRAQDLEVEWDGSDNQRICVRGHKAPAPAFLAAGI